MSDEANEKGAPQYMNIAQIAARFDISRQMIHRIRLKDPNFPAGVQREGSTATWFEEAAVEAYFRDRPKQPGRRTDIERKKAAEG